MKSMMKKAIAGLLMLPCVVLLGQAPPPPPAPPTQALAPQQLDNLVAPIALYPDPLLGQVLAASTYPLEVVEAQQWLQQNANLRGEDLMNAARQQNWDPSVQALVAFPDVLNLLTRDVQWMTDLGNAFLAQQGDVMAAVQRMRARAQQNGKLVSTPQEIVTTETQDDQSAIAIQPADPAVIYVPVYDPIYVWGPPVWGYYPPLWYSGIGFGFGFGPGIYLDAFFPGWGGFGWPGWGLGWGWGCNWFGGRVFGGGLYANAFFFNHYGFHNYWGGGGSFVGGRQFWAHDPYHREGVPYDNRAVSSRFNNARFAAGRTNFNNRSSNGSFAGGTRGFNGGGSLSPGGRSNFNQGSNQGGSRGNGGAGTFSGAPPTGGSPNFGGSFRGNNGASTFGSAPRSGESPNFGSSRGNMGSTFNSARGLGGVAPSYSAPRSFTGSGGSPGSFGSRSFAPSPSFSGRSFSGGGFRGGGQGGGSFGGRSSGGSFGGGGRSFGGGSQSFGGGGRGGRR